MPTNLLIHLGIIMDGNRRWAKGHKLPPFRGHQQGYQTAFQITQAVFNRGIKVLTLYAFSTENWNRSKEEVTFLMNLSKKMIAKKINQLHQESIKLQFLGRLAQLPKTVQTTFKKAMALTKNNKKATLNIAFNYGGRAEIIDAINKIIKNKVNKVTLEIFHQYLYDPEMPPPDLIIRTSGEQRTSGFLLWQSAYSELYFCKKYWPDFSEKDLDEALADYQRRQRRFGK